MTKTTATMASPLCCPHLEGEGVGQSPPWPGSAPALWFSPSEPLGGGSRPYSASCCLLVPVGPCLSLPQSLSTRLSSVTCPVGWAGHFPGLDSATVCPGKSALCAPVSPSVKWGQGCNAEARTQLGVHRSGPHWLPSMAGKALWGSTRGCPSPRWAAREPKGFVADSGFRGQWSMAGTTHGLKTRGPKQQGDGKWRSKWARDVREAMTPPEEAGGPTTQSSRARPSTASGSPRLSPSLRGRRRLQQLGRPDAACPDLRSP